jgi:hypothetical protein
MGPMSNHGALLRLRESQEHGAAEAQARAVAERAATGAPVRLPGVAQAVPTRSSSPWGEGAPLPAALRSVLEATFGTSLEDVRIHTDGATAALVVGLRARALTIGEHIALAPGAYRPDTEEGRALIAHEVAHVVQQRVAQEPTAQFSGGPGDPPIYLRVSMTGIVVSSPGRTLDPGLPVRSQLFALVLRRIVSNYVPGLEDEVIARLPDSVTRSGGFRQEGPPAAAGEPVRDMHVNRGALGQIIRVLRDLGHTDFLLTEEQFEVLLMGDAAARWYEVHRDIWDPWYTYPLFEVHITMHGGLFREVLRREAALNEARESGDEAAIDAAITEYFAAESELIGKLDAPLMVLEAIRADTALAEDEETGPVWILLWGEPGRSAPRRLAHIDAAERMINFYWRQPEVGRAAFSDRDQRIEFIRRFQRWMLRVRPEVTAGDVTQQLIDQPSSVTDPPFPATLRAYPPPHGPANAVPARIERRFAFNVIFPDVFSAFTHYQYAWDVIDYEPPPEPAAAPPAEPAEPAAEASAEGDTGGTAPTPATAPPTDAQAERIARDTAAARAAVQAIEAEREDSVRRMRAARRASMSEVLGSRLARDLDYAAVDMQRIYQTFGPVGVAASPYYLNALVLRPLGTLIRTFLDIITLSAGPGNREHPIEFPEPGIFIVRVAAMPQVDNAAEIRRPPSVAYMPIFALAERDFARVQLEEVVETTREADTERAAYVQTLTDLIAEEEDAELRDMFRELLRDAEREASFWPRAEGMRDRLETRIAELDAELTRLRGERVTGVAAQHERRAAIQLLQQERDRLDREHTQFRQLLTTRAGRVADFPELVAAEALYVGFIGDSGQSLQLTMEWAPIARDDAPASLRANAPVGSHFVVVSDHTTPNSGVRQGVGSTPDAAVVYAVRALLESRMGYGRGQASIRLPSGGTRTIRIEADIPAITSEAIENISLVITVAAVAAAPFTGGSSLTILVPLGIVSGGHAAYRMYTRYEASTLRWDMQTATDLVDIVGAAVAGGVAVRGARAGMAATRFGRVLAVSYQFAEEGTGYLLLGLGLEQQLAEIERNESMSPGEQRARRMMVLGSAMLQAGIMVGQRVFRQGADDLRTERRERALTEGTPTESAPQGERGGAETGPPRQLPEGSIPPATEAPPVAPSAEASARPSRPATTEGPARTEATRPADAAQPTEAPRAAEAPAERPAQATEAAPAPRETGRPRSEDATPATPEAAQPRRPAGEREASRPQAAPETATPTPERAPRSRAQLEEAVGALIGPDGRFTDAALEAAYANYSGPADRATWAWRTGGEPLNRLRSLLGDDFRPPRARAESTTAPPPPVAEATDAALRRRVSDPMNPRDREASAELERRYEQRSIRELVQMERRGTTWDGYYARLVLDRGRGRRGTVTEYLAEVTSLDQLRQMARHDPAAAAALVERYHGMTPAQLERLAAQGDGTAAQVLERPRRGPAMDADVEARLTERMWEQRRRAIEEAEVEAARATDPAARAAAEARGASARSEGTVGALESDIPGIPEHVVRGSPRAPTEVDPGQQRHVRPQTDVALAQYHAEEQLLNWLITRIESGPIAPETLSGRRVRIAVDQQVCSYCLSGVASGEHSGTLMQFSQRYPGLRLEISDIRTGDFVVFQGGQRIVHHRRAGALDD